MISQGRKKQYITKHVKLGMVVHACNPSCTRGRGRRIESSRPAWAEAAGSHLKNKVEARCQWLTSIILATWETEIWRIKVFEASSGK
jgi:hypothetical protein